MTLRTVAALAAGFASAGFAFASFAVVGPAQAQSETYTDTVYNSISPSDLRGIVEGLGYASVTEIDATSFEVTMDSGFLFWVYALTCDEPRKGGVTTRCYGVEVSTYWTVDEADSTGLVQAANDYTANYSLLKAFVDAEGALNAQRYAFTTGGVTRAHIENEITGFPEAVNYMLDEIEMTTTIDFARPYE